MKLGLVLSGGGARGAYQVGVVKALAQLKLEPSVVAGASIGALNGAIVAASTSMTEAATQLEELWLSLKEDTIIQADNAFGILALALIMHRAAEQTSKTDTENYWRSIVIPMLQKLFDRQALIPSYLMTTEPIESLVSQFVNLNRLLSRQARDFYVSIYEASGQPGNSTLDNLLSDLWRYCIERKESEFKILKNCSQEQAIQFLLASAALPIAFKSVQIENKHYRDGGMGDRLTSQGNTPMKPLIDTKCTHAIVSILDHGDLWNRYDWNNIKVKVIHPSESLAAGSTKKIDLLDFSHGRIKSLIQQGEEDTIQHFNELSEWYKLFDDKQTSEANLKQSLERLEDASKKAEISVPWKKIADDDLGSE
jgi:NTE family protein